MTRRAYLGKYQSSKSGLILCRFGLVRVFFARGFHTYSAQRSTRQLNTPIFSPSILAAPSTSQQPQRKPLRHLCDTRPRLPSTARARVRSLCFLRRKLDLASETISFFHLILQGLAEHGRLSINHRAVGLQDDRYQRATRASVRRENGWLEESGR